VVVGFCWGCLRGSVGLYLPVLPGAAFRLFVCFLCLQVFAEFAAVWGARALGIVFVFLLVFCAPFGALWVRPRPRLWG